MHIGCCYTVPGMEGIGGTMVCCDWGAYGVCKGCVDIVTVVLIIGCCCLAKYPTVLNRQSGNFLLGFG